MNCACGYLLPFAISVCVCACARARAVAIPLSTVVVPCAFCRQQFGMRSRRGPALRSLSTLYALLRPARAGLAACASPFPFLLSCAPSSRNNNPNNNTTPVVRRYVGYALSMYKYMCVYKRFYVCFVVCFI